MLSHLPSLGNEYFFEGGDGIAVGHAGYVVLYRRLYAVLFDDRAGLLGELFGVLQIILVELLDEPRRL